MIIPLFYDQMLNADVFCNKLQLGPRPLSSELFSNNSVHSIYETLYNSIISAISCDQIRHCKTFAQEFVKSSEFIDGKEEATKLIEIFLQLKQ